MNPKTIKSIARGFAVIILVTMVTSLSLPAYAAPGDLTRVSVDSSGAQANGGSGRSQLSADGRYVAFVSDATNLISDDTNNVEDVFVKDRQTGATTRVSVASLTGAQANNGSGAAAISADGRYVAFESGATNLVSVDTNGQNDIFVRDLQAGVTILISVDSNGVQANDISEGISISGDGRFIAFSSPATNLSGDMNATRDVFVHDLQTGATTLISVNSVGAQGNGFSFSSKISANGRYVVFSSGATNLADGDTNGKTDVFVRDLQTGQTTMASVNSSGVQANQGATDPSISGDGRYVTFSSSSSNLISEETFELEYVYVHDRQTGTTTLVSVSSDGSILYGWSEESIISADGRYIAFMFDDKGDGEAVRWIYIHDQISGQTVRATGRDPRFLALSGDGRFLAYSSGDSTLVPGDTNGQNDVFVKELAYPPDLSPTVSSVQPRCFGNGCGYPTTPSVSFSVDFSEVVTGVTADDFSLTMAGGISGASVTGVSGSRNQYVVTVNTGTGDGTLRLDVIDDDSIKDTTLNPLGGAGADNGNFTSGEVFVVDKGTPTVVGVTHVDPSPTSSAYVNFAITFSEDVSGVDGLDFILVSSGNVSGGNIVEVTGSGKSYNVKVGPCSGHGTLGLNVIDNDSIRDADNHSIGGDGSDNGTFTHGEEYTIDSVPTVMSSLRLGPNPTAADTVNFVVTFSEAVSGVDASDFIPVTTSSVSGATVAIVNVAENTYTVTVNIGSGDGTIRLDTLDDDSIVDAMSNPLGGVGPGNGNYTGGDAYLVEKNAPVVISSLCTDVNPTNAESIHFNVTFSEAVSGLDAGDFAPATTGSISGATVAEISGIGNTYIVTVNTGTGDGALRLDLIDNDSIVDVSANPLGGAGPGNGNFTLGETYTIDKNALVVISNLRADANPTVADSVHFIVTFSEAASGVDASDFMLITTDNLFSTSIISLSGFANTYTITAATGSGNGTLRLDLIDNDSIVDSANQPLGGAGPGNGNFTTGEAYTIDRSLINIVSETFRSNGTNDGWILESSEDSNKGGSKNSNAATFYLGDNAKDRQYRSILHFPTSYLPDDAVITQAILMIKSQGLVGADPFTSHQNISIDIRNGVFGSFGPIGVGALQVSDFQAPASMNSAGTIQNNPVGGWYWAKLDNTAYPYINLAGVTQFRLGFQMDDNDDRGDDYLKFYSGNFKVLEDRPQLLIEYYLQKQRLPPTPLPAWTPVDIPATPVVSPTPTMSTGGQGVEWAEVPFNDIAPRGMDIQECWNGMGVDDQGRIYIGFTSSRTDGRGDFPVFRYDPVTRERFFLGSFLDTVAAAGNAHEGESIPKGHTRMIYTNGRMYMGSQSFHDLKWEIDSLPTYRGSHLFAFDTTASLWKDLSATLPGGVVTEHEGIISLNILPEEHLLVGLAHPSSDIVLYDYLTEQLIKVIPGIPWKLGNPLSREVIVAPSGNIYTYRGTEAVTQRNETHSVWVYNIHTGEMRDSGFQMTNGLWIGQTKRRDGSKIYINTIAGELYEFDVASETFRDLGYELPKSDNRIIDYTYAITLSPDETKLYYVLSIIQKPGGAVGNGSGGSGELYYYDIATGQVVFVQQLPVGIYTSADLRDDQNIYFAHFGSSDNIWSGKPSLFILHIPSEQ